MPEVTSRMWRTASTMLPEPASPLVRIMAAPSPMRRRHSPRSREPQTNGTLKANLSTWKCSSAGVRTSDSSMKSTPSDSKICASTKWPMRHLAITGIVTDFWISLILVTGDMRATPPSFRISEGTRSSAITATAPASSAILACSALVTSMMTPPFSISASPTFSLGVPLSMSSSPFRVRIGSLRESCFEVGPHRRPLRLQDGEGGGVANGPVAGGTRRAEDAVEAGPEPQDRVARALVARVGHQAHTMHALDIERVSQHQELRLRVDRSPLGGGGQPRPADLGHVRPVDPALVGVAGGPWPELDVEEPRAADHRAPGPVDRGEGQRAPRRLLGERPPDVGRGLGRGSWHGGEAVGIPRARRGREQPRRVAPIEGLQPDPAALQGDRAHHRPHPLGAHRAHAIAPSRSA